ncbi:uncharacterized protein LOC126881347 [Diabrotica virgifera virgifera]|uniref:CRAL-TRIO domain-containing protein n=1 Tax=Diabrotica virgifera virgifera TaxID=50390 RepID=A0ABM5JUC6_DIAVI|nr:uncharacterized protein LOC126881347 [Diabrotica virgifera virgifera]XP_050501540.1 uncharacterized protein LOC126881347 [Diabrotica virgifera virgifera]XP_050501541.1 uncharacterized protein LOC126881347 [Diabrotica virgifera virgifera]XP_050501542.1 uncharacterized protein LOC126881347 [Diabrotica virgifera virgifera]XP_050501543.1 uncharacterized protein LOC126881347 [Diabrotica virgifera virgifera]
MALDFQFKAKDLIAEGRVKQDDIDKIKQFFDGVDEDCVPKSLPEEFIATILIACSSDVALTKKTIISYFSVKKLAPSIFDSRDVDRDDINLAQQTTCFTSIRWPEENTEIIYVKLRDTYYKNCEMEPQLKLSIMIMDLVQTTNPPDNVILVQDVTGIGLMHLTRLKFDALKTFFSYIQEGLPVKLKTVHYVNAGYVLNKFVAIFKLFMKPELVAKLQFHQGTRRLAEHIPKAYIPSEMGGELSSMEDYHVDLIKRLRGMKTYWDQEENLRKKCFSCDE